MDMKLLGTNENLIYQITNFRGDRIFVQEIIDYFHSSKFIIKPQDGYDLLVHKLKSGEIEIKFRLK